jgi:regulator of sigma E protease
MSQDGNMLKNEETGGDIQKKEWGVGPYLWVMLFAIALYFVISHFGFSAVLNVVLVLVCIGLIIISHEFGHFITAKLTDMNVQAFSIGFPPILLGIKRTPKGLRIRILPGLFKKPGQETEDEQSEEGPSTFFFGKPKKGGDTEFRIGLIPFGGYVKILGQEDIGAIKESDDPRSYSNKPVWKRFAVVVMGVVFNAIFAIASFILVFGIGMKLIPPVVGELVPDSPAAKAGLEPGDEIIEIGNKSSFLEFSDLMMAAALSGKEEKISMKVRHQDGSTGQYKIAPAKPADSNTGYLSGFRQFGIGQPISLNITKYLTKKDANDLFRQTGLKPSDKVMAVDEKAVQSYLQLEKMVNNIFEPSVVLKVQRTSEEENQKSTYDVNCIVPLEVISSTNRSSLGDIYTLVPRLRVADISNKEIPLKKGDVIVKSADTQDPNFLQFSRDVNSFTDKEMPLEVLRSGPEGKDQIVQLKVVPHYDKSLKKNVIGFRPGLDFKRPVVADIVDVNDGITGKKIPKGAVITALNGQKLSNYYDIMKIAADNTGKELRFDWELNGTEKGTEVITQEALKKINPAKSVLLNVPFEPVLRLYKARSFIQAVQMGYHKTVTFILQTYVSLTRVAERQVSSKELMGPVGIAALSYQIVSTYSVLDIISFLAMLSACIAALNIVPLLPFDGGLALFLLIEKFKGSPVSARIQNALVMTGWVMVLALFLYVTYNDIMRFFIRPFTG